MGQDKLQGNLDGSRKGCQELPQVGEDRGLGAQPNYPSTRRPTTSSSSSHSQREALCCFSLRNTLTAFKTPLSPLEYPGPWLTTSGHQVLNCIRNFDGFCDTDKGRCIKLVRQTRVYQRLLVLLFAHCVCCVRHHEVINSIEEMVKTWSAWDDLTCLLHHQQVRQKLKEFLESVKNQCECDCDIRMDTLLVLDDISFCVQLLLRVSDNNECRLLLERNEDAQLVLDLLQAVLDQPCLDRALKKYLMKALLKLSRKSSLYPECLVVRGIERLGTSAVGCGSFGDVWKGKLEGHAIAIKELRMYQKSDVQKLLKEFSHEAVLWKQLRHPNVLPFYGMYHSNDDHIRVCLLSPWMENGTITDYLEKNPDAGRVPLVLDVAQGLEYLHTMSPSIIHGDLKGVNILITSSGHACVADFGLATATDSKLIRPTSSSTAQVKGTLRWKAPELLAYEKPVRNSISSDMYSFGCVCYEIFSGMIPFHDLTEYQVLMAVIEDARPRRPPKDLCRRRGLDDQIWSTIEACWRKKPAIRPTASQVTARLKPKTPIDTRPLFEWDYSYMATLRLRTAEQHFTISVPDLSVLTEAPSVTTPEPSLAAGVGKAPPSPAGRRGPQQDLPYLPSESYPNRDSVVDDQRHDDIQGKSPDTAGRLHSAPVFTPARFRRGGDGDAQKSGGVQPTMHWFPPQVKSELGRYH